MQSICTDADLLKQFRSSTRLTGSTGYNRGSHLGFEPATSTSTAPRQLYRMALPPTGAEDGHIIFLSSFYFKNAFLQGGGGTVVQ
uniref:Uncharacterized protein n=1 Tax=Anguilla anguilla TaxID=7936 RepID=A0A0E9VAD3_ANGAN